MYQYEAVIQVMEENGGYATLKHLYQRAPDIPDAEWNTKTPYASIRRIVQERDEIFKIRPGLWALEAYRDELPEHIRPTEETAEEKKDTYDHTFYQGIIAEAGEFDGKETYAPPQDQNQPFLDRTLQDAITTETLPKFGYDNLVQRASTIDVVWLNERDMPHSFFEIEYSTNFQNSLLKFTDLRDYYANFVIVADKQRKEQFEKKLNLSAFQPIQNRVTFLSFDDASTLHSGTEKRQNIGEKLRV